jgi:hypothetical protein
MSKIPKAVKDSTWKKYMGSTTEGKCYCCRMETITVFNFEVGHDKAKSKGGVDDIENLRPICRSCNTSMGTQSIESIRAKHFSSNSKLATVNNNKPKKNAIKSRPATKEELNSLTLSRLKELATKHKIKVRGTTYNEMLFGVKISSQTNHPTKRQYVNKLLGVVMAQEIKG